MSLKLCSLVFVVLLSWAGARPELGVSSNNDVQTKTENLSSEKVEVPKVAQPSSPPVNERFPHAVLFGDTCGGSIISDRWVLSAAHCTIFSASDSIIAGTNNTDNGSGVRAYIKRLVVHPLFSVGPYWLNADLHKIKQVSARWDFLLAELEEPLLLDGKTMASVPLEDNLELPVGLPVEYAGYGAESHGELMRQTMHGMELETVADEVCSKQLEQFASEDMICARGRPPRLDSACNGDSGSGLVGSGRLVGVASWVEGDAHECQNGALVVFSRVAAVRSWIKEITGI